MRRRPPEAGFRLTYSHNATLGRRDFYRQLCLALGLSPKATAAAVFYAIARALEAAGRREAAAEAARGAIARLERSARQIDGDERRRALLALPDHAATLALRGGDS